MARAPPLGADVGCRQVEVKEDVVEGVADEQLVDEKVFQPCGDVQPAPVVLDARHLPVPAIPRQGHQDGALHTPPELLPRAGPQRPYVLPGLVPGSVVRELRILHQEEEVERVEEEVEEHALQNECYGGIPARSVDGREELGLHQDRVEERRGDVGTIRTGRDNGQTHGHQHRPQQVPLHGQQVYRSQIHGCLSLWPASH